MILPALCHSFSTAASLPMTLGQDPLADAVKQKHDEARRSLLLFRFNCCLPVNQISSSTCGQTNGYWIGLSTSKGLYEMPKFGCPGKASARNDRIIRGANPRLAKEAAVPKMTISGGPQHQRGQRVVLPFLV